MLAQEIIRRKRDGATLTADEIGRFVHGIADGAVGDTQIAAFAMAVFLRDMTLDERVALTIAMAESGRTLDWSRDDLPGPVLDKHSSGGVGDAVSLILAPAVAACGGFVPMIAGRGLGHTGGTIDKLESVPGYRVLPELELTRRVTREAGCAIVGATAEIAPADRRMYAVRDVTATVESIPLITASILAKKLAEGLDGLVMDVKFGSGAFMPALAPADELAESLVAVATGAGLPITALLTDMNQVLGGVAGNGLEMAAAVAVLRGGAGESRLMAVTRALSAEMLVLGGLAPDMDEAGRQFDHAIVSGAAAERFARMVTLLGGPADFVDAPARHLPEAPIRRAVSSPRPGVVAAVDVREVGLAVVELGGGRRMVGAAIDHAVGLTEVAGIGAAVGTDRPLAIVHARDEAGFERAAARLTSAFTIGEAATAAGPLVAGRIVGEPKP